MPIIRPVVCPRRTLLDEIYRVCMSGAVVEIVVPLFELISPDHLTCFYDTWFERNTAPGGYFANRFFILSKSLGMVRNAIRHIDVEELRVKLEVRKPEE